MLRPTAAIGFFLSEVVVLAVFLALGTMLYAVAAGDTAVGSTSIWSADEVLRAFGASMLFLILSGYLVSLAVLLVMFRSRPLSPTHAAWATLLFALHAFFFLFYLRAPAVLSSNSALVAVGVVCVIVAAASQYLLWRKWLLP